MKWLGSCPTSKTAKAQLLYRVTPEVLDKGWAFVYRMYIQNHITGEKLMSDELKYKAGDTVVITGNTCGHEYPDGTFVSITSVDSGSYLGSVHDGYSWVFDDDDCTLAIQEGMTPYDNRSSTSSGGPSIYYDMPYELWVTTNDQMEYLAEHKWGKYAIHLKDIFKGLCRWGDKEGTTVEYDTRKVIYYGCRVMTMVVGTKVLRVYLQELLDDKQFNIKGDN